MKRRCHTSNHICQLVDVQNRWSGKFHKRENKETWLSWVLFLNAPWAYPLRFQILLPRRRCICNSHWLPARLIFLISIFAYSLFTAAQFLRRWFSVLTQTVTQTRKNQVDLSLPERIPLRNFPSGKAQEWLEMSAKNIRPTFSGGSVRTGSCTMQPGINIAPGARVLTMMP